jgi:hypothetical protein
VRKALLGSCGLVAALALFAAGYLAHGLTAHDEGVGLSLTGVEAATRAEAALRQSDPSLADTVNFAISCEVDYFNTDTGDWLIRCTVDHRVSGFKSTEFWRVNARTGEAAPNPPVANSRLILANSPEIE